MNQWSDKLALLLVTLWVGTVWAIGYVAAPTLFYTLSDNHPLAGELAGKMFTLVAYVGMVSGFFLLIHRLVRQGTLALKQWFFWVVVIMLTIVMLGEFGIQPIMAKLKAQAFPTTVMQSVFADRFKTWHGIANIGYLIESLLGIVLVLKANR
ncbi:MAG: DUF4149 domain-containing protein [Methylophilaceae bacterium]|uniref:DUF4149 domain-containing protein n=1 Tax=Methylovorus sp. MM2 TaxID=1848038 RepID=UPI0007DF6E5B|nr:DUF4149 domain-containing protein [Methylovorus sp. MM2]OAM52522.1 hypothetical protein A7981_03365 [Methylovorus sp. MM2]